MPAFIQEKIGRVLRRGLVIPAMPLALNAKRKFDERRQRALIRYYVEAGAGGLAVAVHTTQFQIRDARIGLFRPVTALASEEMQRAPGAFVRIGGVCGKTRQAVGEAEWLAGQKYHAVLLSLGAFKNAGESELIAHARAVAEVIPLVGFYLQPAAGGRILPYSFWRKLVELESVAAIKIAPFNRYQTLDVVRATVESGRKDIALYTGNDDNIVADLTTPFRFKVDGRRVERRIMGGLLGHWAVWTQRAVQLLSECHSSRGGVASKLLAKGVAVTDANAAFFDSANGYAGCIPGIHEVLRRQGLLEGNWCLDPKEQLSAGQRQEIDRVWGAYPDMNDDVFVRENLDRWLS